MTFKITAEEKRMIMKRRKKSTARFRWGDDPEQNVGILLDEIEQYRKADNRITSKKLSSFLEILQQADIGADQAFYRKNHLDKIMEASSDLDEAIENLINDLGDIQGDLELQRIRNR